jgi:CRISPR-associated exonuclease Cas4
MKNPPPPDILERILRFCEAAEGLGLNGLDFQHAAICPRRCWLHLRRASLNPWSEHIRLGEIRHLGAHTRDKTSTGLDGLAPDRLDWETFSVIEQKASKSHMEASLDQASFYAAMMTRATGDYWAVRLNLYGSRRNVDFKLDANRIARLEASISLIESLRKQDSVPAASKIAACSGCSNGLLCGHSGD